MSEQEQQQQHTTSLPSRTLKRRRGQRLSPEEKRIAQQKFLDSFRLNANITLASMQAGIDRSQVYRWQEVDETFAQEFKQAELAANDMLLAAAWQRAVKGYEKPIVSMGKLMYDAQGKLLTERVYSDSVLLRLMSYRIPGFSEKTQVDINQTVTAKVNHVLEIDTRQLSGMSTDDLAQLRQWAEKLKAKEHAEG